MPGKALINTRTLAAIYPGGSLKNLTAVQQISMHLLLHRPAGDADSADPAFGPYISTMPRDFDSHPLTWLRRLENATQMDPLRTEETLLKCMSPSTRSALQLLWSRFQEDWNMVRSHLVSAGDGFTIALLRAHQASRSFSLDDIVTP